MTASPIAQLGVCYYPEHWPRQQWREQAAQMQEAGIQLVRIGEFAWSRIEPRRGEFDWDWLDEAMDVLAAASLQIIMCTPTACPPRWLIDEYPDILPVDRDGRVRDFGSRRHYRFASQRYRAESLRISSAVLERYAAHDAIVGWQTDNEFGCHDTTLSYAPEDGEAFSAWLRRRYDSIASLNTAWGTVFWSQEYRDFDEIGRPNLTVTEANPAHYLDYWRFASAQVEEFHRDQAKLIRGSTANDPWITHNFMGNFTDFDHFDLSEDIDIASWDSYPLGFLDQGWFSEEEKQRYRQIGHPDWAAFHHDLYRAVGRGRLAVMEQQPGPVNWAPSNALPVDNAPAFWGMEAVAHGAEFVSYFRFRQFPRAQEQMHAALRLPNGEAAPAWQPVCELGRQLQALPPMDTSRAPVALLFDYPSCWASAIQPHAAAMDSLRTAFSYYSAARRLGVDIDIVHRGSELAGYAVLIIPGTQFVDDEFVQRAQDAGVACLIGPRSGSRTEALALPEALAPGALQSFLPLRVLAVDSLRAGAARTVELGGHSYRLTHWFEVIDSDISPELRCNDGQGFWYRHDKHHYLNASAPEAFIQHVLADMLTAQDVETTTLEDGLRQRRRGALRFVFNFCPQERQVSLEGARRLLGDERLKQGDYAVWQDA